MGHESVLASNVPFGISKSVSIEGVPIGDVEARPRFVSSVATKPIQVIAPCSGTKPAWQGHTYLKYCLQGRRVYSMQDRCRAGSQVDLNEMEWDVVGVARP